MLHLARDDEMLKQLKRGPVHPLQVVQEQDERMLRTREHGEESLKDALKAIFGVLGRQFRNGRQRSEDELEFRDEIGDYPAIGFDRLSQIAFPPIDFHVASGQDLAEKRPEGLREGGI